MRLSRILDKDLVVPRLKSRYKIDAIGEILDMVIQKHPHLDRETLEAKIIERENIENTSYGRGFAFPHARTDAVDEMYTALGLAPQGLEDKTKDQQKLQVICLMLTPSTISRSYLQTLSAFASFARTPGNTERLLSAGTVEEIIDVIEESGVEVKRELSVGDVMKRDVITVKPEDSLKTVANVMFKHRISGVIVVDDENHVVGMISNRDIIRAALPDYQSLISNLAMSYDSESFENILRTEENVRVGDLMDKNVETVTEDTSVVETAALMLFKDLRRAPIIKNDKLVGVITISDIVSKIIRG
ncbi:MAG: CBS domain-containing protein [candidate division Zixibacteria bacterium]|nr:CBS domain-containing protein [candidate division Zixibacteria bacterium]NIR66026.1 CBS domain-containing protein [candidate division Zixibacteria bacterium]NIS17049.1 CBS domain-containing protein [candidate division Zixibacteria bacterium]NIS47657.1 CBS domain-containing protein [candidate division Zixibacteria bacterium]NIT53419.1 CBS domain-containing protein [candidate division Zixibacteria bacterium]